MKNIFCYLKTQSHLGEMNENYRLNFLHPDEALPQKVLLFSGPVSGPEMPDANLQAD